MTKKPPLLKNKTFWTVIAFILTYVFVFFLPSIIKAITGRSIQVASSLHVAVGPQTTPIPFLNNLGGGLNLPNTFFSAGISSIVFAVIIIILGTGLKKRGSTRTILAEILVTTMQSFTKNILGKNGERYVVATTAIFGYILVSNFLGLLSGLATPFIGSSISNSKIFSIITAPTTDLSVTFGLAIAAVIYVHTQSIKWLGFKHYFKETFMHPYPFMLPINIIEQISRPLSLAVRLFGNLTGEHIVLEVITGLVSFGVPIVILGLGIFTGFVQALVFTMLFLVYLSLGIPREKGEH
jgi:F-type H+-transporting ATPase subunit a